MEVTSWNVHHESYLMERIPWKITSGNYTMEVLMELTSWKLPTGTYTMEVT